MPITGDIVSSKTVMTDNGVLPTKALCIHAREQRDASAAVCESIGALLDATGELLSS